ncbi:hypothetical protein A3A21_02080 [Candidatus Jorgensenbacteria bacterium RIFCSPLOWO2_01_FULL_45_25b]|uniref:Uncharacterized protein n=1 Tax=Candidatus Jorgensenbacteria bacterium RIFCSPLOWO2_01_FULL_45_25b TaxID=1798471 RepID=A0A1F6BZ13_9BACT|nr:MAG: hypothetical protein A3A21_02080 [Candidatus Jorgensenbacteria bacterium RIFCSPLOWO2_01_FULL_45_25b]
MKKTIYYWMGGILLFAGVFAFFRLMPIGQSMLWNVSDGGKMILPLVLVSALIDSINPCAFSVLLLTIAFLMSIGKGKREMWKIGGVYIAGLYASYLLIGLGILRALHILNTPHFMAKAGAVLLIVLGGIQLIGHYLPAFPIRLRIPKKSHELIGKLMEKASIPTAFLLGILVGICEFPCTGGPYLMILGLLHDTASYTKGFAYLLIYNVVFVSPLILVLGLAGNKSVLGKVEEWKQQHMGMVKMVGGIVAILLGALIFIL